METEMITEFEETLREDESEALTFPDTSDEEAENSENAPDMLNDFDRLESLKKHESIVNEYKEFSELFPGVSLSELPDSVNDSVRAGVPLAAAYALYHRKKEAAMAAASEVNKKNREKSFAVKRNDSSDSYFSPSEVKAMSAAEVKANYSKIIDSMSHWQ